MGFDALLDGLRALESRLASARAEPIPAPIGSQRGGKGGDGNFRPANGALLEELGRIRTQLERLASERQAERLTLEQLRESEARWRSIVVNPYDFVVVVDRGATFQYVNHTDPRVKMEDLIGKATIYDYTVPENHAAIRAALACVFEEGKPAYYEAYSPQVEGWFAVVVGPIVRDERVVEASLMARNITERKQSEMALRDSEERFRQLAEHVEDLFFLLDARALRALYVSPVYESLYGRPLEGIYADAGSWMEAVHPEDQPAMGAAFREMLATCAGSPGASYRFGRPHEFRLVRPDGSQRWVRARNFPVLDADGHPTRVAGIVTDITERREAEQKLAEAEAKYRLLVERLPVISYIARSDQTRATLYVSPQIEWKLGFTQAEWTADPHLWSKCIHPDDRLRVLSEVQRLVETGAPLRTLYRILARDGSVLWFRDEAVLVRDDVGKTQMIEGVMLDVSEAEEARAEKDQARALSSHLVEVQEGERRHIARELHDEVGQTLTGLNLLLQMIQECPGERPGALGEARTLVGELLEKVRDLSLELRPSMLDDLGLLPGLLSMFERYRKQTQVRVDFEHRGIEERFDPEVETAAYRLVQEALTNAARHAQVSEVRVRVWSDGSALNLQVEDDGTGFDVDSALAERACTGLVGMQERVALLGGELTLESLPGSGTCLTVQLPARPAPRGAAARECGTVGPLALGESHGGER